MPDLWQYMPILKCKLGEKQALEMIAPEIKSQIRPLIEVVELEGKTLDSHLQTSFKGLDRALPPGTQFFLDAHEVLRSAPSASERIYGEAAARGLSFIPVIGLSSSPHQRAATIDHNALGIAVRIGRDDLEADRVVPSLTALLTNLAMTPDHIDIVMDMGSIPHMVLPGAAALARAFIDAIPRPREWRTFVLAGTAFPMSMRIVERDSHRRVPRLEWLVWRDVMNAEKKALRRQPHFGDCGIQHPAGVEKFDRKKMQASAAIRYAAGDDWLLVKGRGTRAERPGLQFPRLARQLAPGGGLNANYAGQKHCQGCEDIAQAALEAPRLGSPGAWRRIGTVHHITLVVEQIAASREPAEERGPQREAHQSP